ncbi:neprilysin isoform X1 [Takifugu rubripes]|uniref:Neprilysin n=2 Tax=Takifugu rubripes TaxID=31033 RepID=H2RP85_TAKRU|nr:neprilysin isoform X1 [Takifugu rubripes]
MPIYIIERKFAETSGELIGLEHQAEAQQSRMTETAHSKLGKKSRWTSLEIGLITIVSLFFIIIVALIVLFAVHQKYEVCTTADCTSSAARLLENMDTSVDPCDNFFEYACGSWLKQNVIPESSSVYSTFMTLRDSLDIFVKEVLEKTVEGEAVALTKAKTLYKSCINDREIEKRGGTPLIEMLPDVYDWPIAVDNWEAKYGKLWRLEDVIAKLNVNYGSQLVINFFIGIDDKDSSSHIIHYDQQGSLGLPSRDQFACTGSSEALCKAYMQFMTELAKLIRNDRGLAVNETQISEEVIRILEFESDLANATDTQEDRNHPGFLYNKMELGDLNANFTIEVDSQKFNWSYFTAKIMNTVNVTIPETEKIMNYAPNYFRRLNHILAKYSKRDLQNYMVWRFVMSMVMSLSGSYRETRKEYRKVVYGTIKETEMWRQCVSFVNNNMDEAVGRLYVEQAFSEKSKEMIIEMIKEIQEVFINNLEQLTWMDRQTKEAAKQKAKAIREQIGYDDKILDDEYLNSEYSDINFSADKYFENILHNSENSQKKRLQKLHQKVNRENWVTGAAVVNAFYSTSKNQIVFPAGILQLPFFSKSQSNSLNYGGIGMVIGHEITHGFDNNGRHHDEKGDMKDWWTKESNERFLELSKCMVNQYSNFTLDVDSGTHMNGKNTLAENIADNGGLRQAFQAYKNHVAVHGPDPPLPGIDLSHDQLFFLNFAQVWCSKARPEHVLSSVNSDTHSQGIFRVLGTLQNFPQFAETFKCKNGSYMSPEKRCRVW